MCLKYDTGFVSLVAVYAPTNELLNEEDAHGIETMQGCALEQDMLILDMCSIELVN